MEYKYSKNPKFKYRIRQPSRMFDQTQEQQLPGFVIYRKNRKPDYLRDFQYQNYRRADSFQLSKQRYSTQQDSQYQITRNLKQSIQQNKEIKKNLVQLKQLLNQINNKTQFQQSRTKDLRSYQSKQIQQFLLERKITQFMHKYNPQMPKHIPQSFSNTIQTNNPSANFQLPPIEPKGIPPNLRNTHSIPIPIEDQKTKLKRKKAALKRLRKIIIVVSFPILLRKYAQKLIKIRQNYYKNNIQQKKSISIDLFNEWQLHIIQSVIKVFTKKKEFEIDFMEQENPKARNQKMKLAMTFVNLITKQLTQNSEPDILKQFIDYIELTCWRGSFISQGFFLKKQLKNLYYSQKYRTLHATKSIQEVQIILFVFIKGLIYKNLLNYKKLPQNQNKSLLKKNLMIAASILYHCCCELIQLRLKQSQKKAIMQGNFASKIKSKVILYETTKQQNEYISGLIKKEKLNKLITWQEGSFWKYTKQNLERILLKFYKLAKKQHKMMNRYYKETELKT